MKLFKTLLELVELVKMSTGIGEIVKKILLELVGSVRISTRIGGIGQTFIRIDGIGQHFYWNWWNWSNFVLEFMGLVKFSTKICINILL